MKGLRLLLPALFLLAASAGPLAAADLRPLSAADKVRLEALLRNFDPATYDIRIEYFDAKGKVQKARYGQAVGLGSVRQGPTTKGRTQASAGDVIIVHSGLGASQTVNGFKAEAVIIKDPWVDSRVHELNTLLKGYAR